MSVATRKTAPPSLIALTMGDPAGIGPDLTLEAWRQKVDGSSAPFVAIGDPDLFNQRARLLGLGVPVCTVSSAADAPGIFPGALPVLPIRLVRPAQPGQPDPRAAPAVLSAIEKGVDLVMGGDAAALVTNPINKALLYDAGFSHAGHTEFLGELAQARGAEAYPVMMLVCDEFRVVPATVHIPLKDVPNALSQERLVRVAQVTANALKSRFGIPRPRLAVTGLNPHAGEDGALGREEIEIIQPALRELAASGVETTGPHPADTIFQERLRARYDAVITMYHDQALIPVKTLAFDRAVNVTLGLPFVRTSPDHGTAYDLAGTGRANPSSLITALRLAGQLGAVRKAAA
jgi:4-hydroxythreonine-4-phosphate dehydrogenase